MPVLKHVTCLFLAVLLCVISVHGNENSAIDCCLKTSNHAIQQRILQRYEEQKPEDGCPLAAVVFITKNGKRLCAPPNLPWVLKRKKQLDVKKSQGGAQKKTPRKKPNKPNKPKKQKGKRSSI
ncbi:C-C motif chemokine 19-like [Ambystoma mexicanum]|uniref:C-C motif chemokine 19-like n=1 Tax=Ambystoma mexicanum TaxID=8296 RepID=UPI0037E915A0